MSACIRKTPELQAAPRPPASLCVHFTFSLATRLTAINAHIPDKLGYDIILLQGTSSVSQVKHVFVAPCSPRGDGGKI
jgi:hypothetical protein